MYLVPQLRGDEKAKYLRKSQTDDPLLSVEEILAKHEKMLDDWNELHQPDGGPVPEENTFREIGSGETIKDRPAMKELLRLVENPKIKAVMCVETSRLSRGDLEDIGYLIKILRYTKTLVITLDFVYDLDDPGDRDRFERELMRGKEYLEYTKKIRENGRIASVKAGNFIGQIPPYGYTKVTYRDGRRTVHTLEPDPERAETVRMIFELYTQGLGMTRISDYLNEGKYPPPNGERWSPESIPPILRNDHYLGKVRWNARKTVRTVEDGEVKVSRPLAEEYLLFDGKHPAIIDQELWDKVQAIRGKNPRNPKAKNLTNPLAGILFCTCGRAMSGRTYSKKGVTRCEPRFLCIDQRTCGTASARMSDVITEVTKTLHAALEEFELRVESGKDDTVERHRQAIARMEKRLADLRKQEVKQWAEKMKNGMPDHVFRELNAQTVAEIEELEQAIHELRDSTPEPMDLQTKIVTLQTTLAAMQDPDAPVKEKNRLLRTCFKRITYSRERYSSGGTPKGMVETPIDLDFEMLL